MDDDTLARRLRHLEDARRRVQERIDKRQAAVNERFEKARERIEQRSDRKSLSQERIIEAALELLKERDLGGLSLRDIAMRLDIKAPALYWHFKNKEELVDYMAEAILRKEFPTFTPLTEGQDWKEWLITMMERLRKAMLAYPDGGRVVAGAHLYPAISLAEFSDVSIASLLNAGLSPKTAHDIVLTATHYTFGHVIEEQAAPTPEQITEFFDTFLERYPAMEAGMEAAHTNPDDAFRTGLSFIIKGALQT